jgi:isopenicillin N synthase-like dioxygenase
VTHIVTTSHVPRHDGEEAVWALELEVVVWREIICVQHPATLIMSEFTSPSPSESSPTVTIPVIDFSLFLNGSPEQRNEIAHEIGRACEEIGFLIVKNSGVDREILDSTWEVTKEFFDRPQAEKELLIKEQSEYPYGYTAVGGEILNAGKASELKTESKSLPDLKEMFSIGPANPLAGMPPRIWPENPVDFQAKWEAYYEALTNLANQILKAFAISLNLPENYFEQFTTHHASAIRALNYPHLEGYEPQPGQIRASAHTDYGTITILRSGGPGLQVSKDRNPPNWVDVPHMEDVFIINLGDLMRRWTNDKWQSTLHQVINPPSGSGWGRRQSMAFFHNLNPDAVVSVIGTEEPKYEPIVAGDFLLQKHLASMAVKGATA